jgi:hypothetical protein
MEDVADRCARGTRHDGDALRQHRQRLLAIGVEESFFGELLFQLLECELQCAESGGLGNDGVELELPFRFVDRQPPANDQLQSVLDAKAQEARVRREEDDANLCA